MTRRWMAVLAVLAVQGCRTSGDSPSDAAPDALARDTASDVQATETFTMDVPAADTAPLMDALVADSGAPDASPMDSASEASGDDASLDGANAEASAVDAVEASSDGALEASSGEAGSDAGSGDAASDALTTGDAMLSPNPIPERRVACGPRRGTPSVTAGTNANYVLRGRIVSPATVLDHGEVFVSAGRIGCVAADCSATAGYAGATIVETAGLIYPGLIDGHNHPGYNWLPPWPPPRLFGNHSQWQGTSSYDAFVTPYRDNSGAHLCAMTKYGEARSLVSGTTSIEGAGNRTCVKGALARNLEFATDFAGIDHHQTNILGISTVTPAAAMTLRMNMDSGALTTYILHLAEGVDETARTEFDQLAARNLVTGAVVAVHGTAGGIPEFTMLGAVGARLVWSPRSNVILYGHTTNIPEVLRQHMQVALAPDWSPSGGPNLLAEMRYARYVSQTLWGGLLTSRDLVEMVTSRAAQIMDRQTMIGSIQVGMFADLMVIPDMGCDPYDSLVDAPVADVSLVMLDGRFVYGDAPLMRAMPTAAQANCEDLTICTTARRLCVSQGPGASDGKDQTFAQITAEIQTFFPTPYPLVPDNFCP